MQSTCLKLALHVPPGSHAHPGTNRCVQGCVGLFMVRPGLPAHLQTLRPPNLSEEEREEESEEDAMARRQGNGPRGWNRVAMCPRCMPETGPGVLSTQCPLILTTTSVMTASSQGSQGRHRGSERPAPHFQVRKQLSSPRRTCPEAVERGPEPAPGWLGVCSLSLLSHGNTHPHW